LRIGKFNIVCGAQAGSEAKGKFAAFLAEKYSKEIQAIVMAGSPNAGHTVVVDGKKTVTYHLPVSAVGCDAPIYLGPSSLINAGLLRKEIVDTGIDLERITIDPRAAVITDVLIRDEERAGLSDIGSTLQGIGSTRILKMKRDGTITLARDCEELIDMGVVSVEPVSFFINDLLDSRETVLCEMTQGFDLDLEHGIDPRYCFARGTRILLENGNSVPIEELVRDRIPASVLSYNSTTGLLEPKKVINWYKTPHGGDWYRVHTDLAVGDKSAPKCTGGHKYYTQRGKVEAKDLMVGDLLYTNEYSLEGTNCLATVRCTGVEKLARLVYGVKYNIEVEDNHNYFAGNQFGYTLVGNCTSKMINPAMAMAEAGVSPKMVGHIYGVLRPYPIRVNNRTGSSGPYADAIELKWENVAKGCGHPDPDNFGEITTTTKLPRRVFSFSWERYAHFIRVARPDLLCMQFANYLNWDDCGKTNWFDMSGAVRAFVETLEKHGGWARVAYVGTGPEHKEMIDMRVDRAIL